MFPVMVPTKRTRNEANLSSESDSDSDYFETDLTDIKETVCKYICSKLSADQKKGLKKKIAMGVDEAFDEVSDIINEKFDELEKRPTSNLWKLGLGPEEIKKYTPLMEKLRKSSRISIKKILNSSLEWDIKQKAVRLYDSLKTLEPYSEEYYELIDRISDLLKDSSLDKKLLRREKKLKKILATEKTLKEKILSAEIDDQRCAAIYEQYLQLCKTPVDSTSFPSLWEWIHYALKTPTNSTLFDPEVDPMEYLQNLRKALDQYYGLQEAKEVILEIFNRKLRNPDSRGLIIGFLGSPGTGKTALARAIATAFGTAFHQISLGGITDPTVLEGMHPGWVSSKPGRIAAALAEMGTTSGVILFDEADKLCNSREGIAVENAMLAAADPTQNDRLNDHYLGEKMPVDLSKCILIYAMNSLDGLSPAFKSRIPIINIPDYSKSEKVDILLNYLFPKVLQVESLPGEQIVFESENAKFFVDHVESTLDLSKGKEGGVRHLEQALGHVIRKCSMLLSRPLAELQELKISYAMPITIPLILDQEMIKKLYRTPERKDKQVYSMYL